ncbi:peptidoglycan DD-metalloendopeptidase family protein [Bacillota bacterium Lsc_1132]
MLRSRTDDIRRRIAKRRKESRGKGSERKFVLPEEDEKYGFNQLASYEPSGREDEIHPLFRKEVFLFKILASICLFLVIGIVFRNQSPALDSTRSMVKSAFAQEFQFAAVSKWYENKFGKPLALLPFNDKKPDVKNVTTQYAVPASGRILENFKKNGQGVMVETGKGAPVKAFNEGVVTFAGIKEGIGKTVIIQHSDKTESWYGNLDQINVSLYEYIGKGKEVGTVSSSSGKDKTKGAFYFAIKKGDTFIDPMQVIRFD